MSSVKISKGILASFVEFLDITKVSLYSDDELLNLSAFCLFPFSIADISVTFTVLAPSFTDLNCNSYLALLPFSMTLTTSLMAVSSIGGEETPTAWSLAFTVYVFSVSISLIFPKASSKVFIAPS